MVVNIAKKKIIPTIIIKRIGLIWFETSSFLNSEKLINTIDTPSIMKV